MTGGMRIDSYKWSGGQEAMLRFGPDGGAQVILALPLHDEANRMRAFAVALLRALAALGIGGVLPDFPGTGDSLIKTRDATLSAIRQAYADLAPRAGFRAEHPQRGVARHRRNRRGALAFIADRRPRAASRNCTCYRRQRSDGRQCGRRGNVVRSCESPRTARPHHTAGQRSSVGGSQGQRRPAVAACGAGQ